MHILYGCTYILSIGKSTIDKFNIERLLAHREDKKTKTFVISFSHGQQEGYFDAIRVYIVGRHVSWGLQRAT